jgi:uncharacterized membrane protein
MSKFQWLLFLHIAGVFLLLGGAVIAAALNLAALRRERPSEIGLLFGLIRIAVVSIVLGALVAFVFGLWLVDESGFDYGDGWIVAAIVMLVAALVLGASGGRRDARTRKLAEELAAGGDEPSTVLRQRVRNPLSLALSYGSGLLVFAVLGIMIWKPGA